MSSHKLGVTSVLCMCSPRAHYHVWTRGGGGLAQVYVKISCGLPMLDQLELIRMHGTRANLVSGRCSAHCTRGCTYSLLRGDVVAGASRFEAASQ